jgi:tRNA A22 N-methylase
MLVIGPILDDENEPIQIINVKLLLFQINDNSSNTKDSLYFNLWTHDAKELMNQDKKYWEIISHDLPTKQKVFNLC